MLNEFINKQVTIFFIGGQNVSKGTITEIDEKFVKYKTQMYEHIIPLTAIRNVQLQVGERPRNKAVYYGGSA
ncbi:hypothetical protein GZH47_02130 [Paenibacillus rhizovicinus]|uniref:Uncharacterized protein n=1 Tax=Paenibacillus rhizovicinus TaxID=2704463 RepID=A0A6C0NVI5_9BACL|nr:hypothetical protein [Paenibacillus rhizovicinus]QHW29753.1 hypothetical protein GZH47_02130 [Paenibacillus rhizovicinus]